MKHQHFLKTISAVLLAALLLAGCGKTESAGSDASAAESVSASAEPSAAPSSDASFLSGVGQLTGTGSESSSRPVAVMIRNSTGRQWGISSADVVVEALTEGKYTNLMLWYSALENVPKVGPVAEGKDVFWQLAMPENSVLVERGSNTYAFNLMNLYAYQPIDALYTGVNCFDYDSSSASAVEYNWYTKAELLQTGLDSYGLSATGTVPQWLAWAEGAGGSADGQTIRIQYSTNLTTVLTYNGSAYELCRKDGTAQTDANDGTQPAFTNVIVLLPSAGVKDDKYTRDYDLTGGDGLYLTGGTWQKITWTKGDPHEALQLFNADGSTLAVAPGKTYLGILGLFDGQGLTIEAADGTEADTGIEAPAPIVTPEPTAAPELTPEPAAEETAEDTAEGEAAEGDAAESTAEGETADSAAESAPAG